MLACGRCFCLFSLPYHSEIRCAACISISSCHCFVDIGLGLGLDNEKHFEPLNLRTGKYAGKVSRTFASGEKELGRAWQQLSDEQRKPYYLKARLQQQAREELQSQALNVAGTCTAMSSKEDLSKGQQQRLAGIRVNKSLQDWPWQGLGMKAICKQMFQFQTINLLF